MVLANHCSSKGNSLGINKWKVFVGNHIGGALGINVGVREVVRERVVKMMQTESSNGRFRVSAIFCFVLGRESEVWCGG